MRATQQQLFRQELEQVARKVLEQSTEIGNQLTSQVAATRSDGRITKGDILASNNNVQELSTAIAASP